MPVFPRQAESKVSVIGTVTRVVLPVLVTSTSKTTVSLMAAFALGGVISRLSMPMAGFVTVMVSLSCTSGISKPNSSSAPLTTATLLVGWQGMVSSKVGETATTVSISVKICRPCTQSSIVLG